MVTAVAAALPVAMGLALAALPVVLIPVALATRRPPAVARAFLGGWLLGVCVVGGVVIVLADVLVLPSGGDAAWLRYLKITLGLLLLVLAVRKWLSRPRRHEVPEPPAWMARVGSMTASGAFALAFALASVNPKNMVLVVSGATVIADATSVPLQQAVALVLFALVGSLGVGAPTVVVAVLGARATDVLAAADRWMTRYGTVIVAVVLAVLGVLLTANGIAGLRTPTG
jgi:threonine/homoserine/homoserine lactone efflux protein